MDNKNNGNFLLKFLILVIIVSIAFGVSLQQAFWSVIGWFGSLALILLVIAGVAIAGLWFYGSKTAHKVAIWGLIIVSFSCGAFLAYQGVTKYVNNEVQYSEDLLYCSKANVNYTVCAEEALNNKSNREYWRVYEVLGGVIFISAAAIATYDYKKGVNPVTGKKIK